MTRDEFLDFYEEHWNDHNTIYAELLKLFDQHEREMALLKNSTGSVQNNECSDKDEEIIHLKALLQKCQDSLDEERHQLDRLKKSV